MVRWIAEASPRLKARIAGFLYLLIFVAAPSGAATATPLKMIITLTCDTGVALLFYDLFKPVSRSLSLIAALFRLMLVAVLTAASLSYFGVAVPFENVHSSAAFNTGYGIALVPFGLHCLVTGYLIFKSGFLPRILGVLLAMAGTGYLTFLWPRLGDHLFFPYIVIPGVVGEGSLTLWLLIKGVNVRQWKEQVDAARAGGGPSGN
jgi:Domain of unknown function (DUF4386)